MFGARTAALKGCKKWNASPWTRRLAVSPNPHRRHQLSDESQPSVEPQDAFSRLLTATKKRSNTQDSAPWWEESWTAKNETRSPPHFKNPARNNRLKYSPSKTLAQLLALRDYPLWQSLFRRARNAASNRSLRLPVITLQAILREKIRNGETNLQRLAVYLEEETLWQRRIVMKSGRPDLAENVAQWVWILSAESPDAVFERFISSDCYRPLFLLLLVIGRGRTVSEVSNVVSVLDFVHTHYVFGTMPESRPHPDDFVVLARRLIDMCMEAWPSALPAVARLIAAYIERVPLNFNEWKGWNARCKLYNAAITALIGEGGRRGLEVRRHSWAAQKELLLMSSKLNPPLVLGKTGYSSIRRVLLGLKKSDFEVAIAARAVKTWPPYRRSLDGIDEQRKVEDDLSRSAKAGLLMQEAGYSMTHIETAISVLGGGSLGLLPAIQTRSRGPFVHRGKRANLNLEAPFLAQIEATRNATEAWAVFNPQRRGRGRTINAYALMFEKLFAKRVANPSVIMPGDTKMVYLAHDRNFSEYQRVVVTPPSAEKLYSMLREDGLSPTGYCLHLLVRNSTSLQAATSYISDSPYYKSIPILLEQKWGLLATHSQVRCLQETPSGLFNSWIQLLCNVRSDPPIVCDITHAIHLTTMYHRYTILTRRERLKPWYSILQALAGPKMMRSQKGKHDNWVETLSTFFKVLDLLLSTVSMDVHLFENFCLMISKTMKLAVFSLGHGNTENVRKLTYMMKAEGLYLLKAQARLVRTFNDLVEPVERRVGDGVARKLGLPTLRHEISGRVVYVYMKALASFDNRQGMVELADWVLGTWESCDVLTDAKTPFSTGHLHVMKLLAYFDSFARRSLPDSVRTRLHDRLVELRRNGCPWAFPKEYNHRADVVRDLRTGLWWAQYRALRLGLQRSPLESGEMTEDASTPAQKEERQVATTRPGDKWRREGAAL
ncbi:hypothetical protein B0H66DRAFT_552042 [Apodospora peruviana]|uniref:Uncharacterized protein n=1 Tax=Apodospora peruviana TaxID=516989 RepID=A0AAE0IAF5_9PEZI|nr:hypothetical protein B0H66DRAFT_552042 [Apodospora peruviana]